MKRKLISALLSSILAVSLVLPAEHTPLPDISVTAEAASVAAPTATVKSGTYEADVTRGMSVKLNCTDKSAKIYYSLNGGSYTKYKGMAVSIKENTVMRIYAQTSAGKSKTMKYTYKVTPKLTFSTTVSSYGKTLVWIAPNSVGAAVTMYYTTDGTKPTTSSKKYTGTSGIEIAKDCTLRVLARKDKWTDGYSSYKVEDVNDSLHSQKGQSTFTTPTIGYSTILYNGKKFSPKVEYDVYDVQSGKEFDGFEINIDGTRFFRFYIASDAKLKKGGTLNLSDMQDSLGSGIDLENWGLRKSSSIASTNYSSCRSIFKKAQVKALELDYTGTTASKFYVYVLVADESGNQQSLEGIFRAYISDTCHDGYTTSKPSATPDTGSGNNSTTPDSGSGTKPDTQTKTYTSLDGRFSVDLGEADILIDGKRYTGKGVFVDGAGLYDKFLIKGFDGDKLFQFMQIANCVLPGKSHSKKDFDDAVTVYNRYKNSTTGVHLPSISVQLQGLGITSKSSSDKIWNYDAFGSSVYKSIDLTFESQTTNTVTIKTKIVYYDLVDKNEHTFEAYTAIAYVDTNVRACSICTGSGECQVCHGFLYNGKCTSCKGSGRCKYCDGYGYIKDEY